MVGRAFWAQGGAARNPWAFVAVIGAVALIAGLLAALSFWTDLRLTPYLPLAVVSLGVAAVFARGLRRGARPIILQLIDVMGIGPEPSPEFRSYARRQSVAWVAMSLAMAAAALVGMAAPAWRVWADVAIPTLAALQLAWFVVSHNIGQSRYSRPEGWRDTLKAMTTLRTWTALEV